MPQLLFPAFASMLPCLDRTSHVVRGVLLNDDDPYIVKATDGTIYKAEWYSGDSAWSQGDRVILTNDNGQGQMVRRTQRVVCRELVREHGARELQSDDIHYPSADDTIQFPAPRDHHANAADDDRVRLLRGNQRRR
jgi:hypothetical protein